MEHNEKYHQFIKKFETKRTTDDCYTPPAVYDVVLDYVKEKCDIEGLKVVRPFYPNGDYQSENYEGCVVVDNPPFSIFSHIIRFYLERNIKFFLFAPHLTLFGTDQDYTGIVVGVEIVYDNGAKVSTSFVSNMFGDIRILGDVDLHQRLKKVQELNKACLPSYKYPDNIITANTISQIVSRGVSIKIKKKDVMCHPIMDAQKPMKKKIFGGGFIVSDRVADEIKRMKEKEIQRKVVHWELSNREKEIIKTLG